MIGFLTGTVRFTDPDAACVVTGGVGYRVLLPANDLARHALPGAQLDLYVHTHVREDAIVLYGFVTQQAHALFERLLAVQGVGPRTALAALSGMEPADLVRAIAESDEARLTKIAGVGKKTAARIVLELKEKMQKETLAAGGAGSGGGAGKSGRPLDDLRSALANLGYKAPQIERAVAHVKPSLDKGSVTDGVLSDLVREALKHLG